MSETGGGGGAIGGSIVQGAQFENNVVSVQTTSAEHPEVRQSRLRREEADAGQKRWMARAQFIVGIAIVVIVLIACLVVIAMPASAENKNQAWRVIYLIIGTVLGFLAGRAGGQPVNAGAHRPVARSRAEGVAGMDSDIALKVAEGALALKLLGPSADYLGRELQTWTERRVTNVDRIFARFVEALGPRIDDPGSVHPKVLKEILDDGSFAEDDLSAAYFGGVLASSRSGVERDDRGASFARMVAGLSTYQLRAHYFFYLGFRRVLKGRDIYSRKEWTWRHLEMFVPMGTYVGLMEFVESETSGYGITSLLTHSLDGLQSRGLIHSGWLAGPREGLLTNWPQVPGDGILVAPTSLGVELFLWAHGVGQLLATSFFDPDQELPSDGTDHELGDVRALVPDEHLHIGRSA